MFQLLKAFGKQFGKAILAIVMPALAYRKATCSAARYSVIGIHVCAILALIALAFFIQQYAHLDQYVRSSSAFYRHAWLPIFGTLLYSLAWATWYLVLIARSPRLTRSSSELESAWQQARDRISRAGIDFRKTPVFLTLGRPTGGIQNFFSAAGYSLTVPPTPASDDAPIRVCGSKEALFICCDRSSLLDDFVTKLAKSNLSLRSRQSIAASNMAISADSADATLDGDVNQPIGNAAHHWDSTSIYKSPTADSGGRGSYSVASSTLVAPTVSTATKSAQPLASRIEAQLEFIQQQVASLQVLQPTTPPDMLVDLDTVVAAEAIERLHSLCDLISNDRDPYCPINGVVCMIPLAATQSVELADHIGMRIERDLQTIVQRLELSVSVQVVLTGFEELTGAKVFLNRFPKAQRDRRFGAVIPCAPASEPQAQSELIEESAQWLCNELFPPLVSRLLARDLRNREVDDSLVSGNLRLQLLAESMRHRVQGMSRMLRRCFASTGGALRIRGCYIAATGDDALHAQGFASGIIPMIVGSQSEVSWLDSRRRKNALLWLCTAAGYTTITLAILGLTLLFSFN